MTVDENILGFDVPVDNVPIMQVFQGFSNDLKELFSLTLRQAMLLLRQEIVVERICTPIFLNQVNF